MKTKRSNRFVLFYLGMLSGLCLGWDALFARQDGQSVLRTSSNDIVPGFVVVKIKTPHDKPKVSGVNEPGFLMTIFAQYGATSVKRMFPSVDPLRDTDVAKGKVDLSRIHLVSVPLDQDPRKIAAKLANLPLVEYAEPKYRFFLCDVPNDSDYVILQKTYFDRMNVPAGWSLQKGSPNVAIATIDGGTYWRHTDLLPNIWVNDAEDLNHNGKFDRFPPPGGDINGIDDDGNGFVDDVVGWNFPQNTNNPAGWQPINQNHGTATASVFGACTNNLLGMAGTSWNCRVMPVCAADSTQDNCIAWGIEGIQYASAKGARVINCSWERATGPEVYSQYEQDIITGAAQAGSVIIAAAGNDGKNIDVAPIYPASYNHVLSVGATTDTSDVRASFSNYGTNVGAFAPGVRIRVALNDSSYGTMNGTSQASPLVAGLAGLIAVAHPTWTADQIIQQIRMTADQVDDVNPGVAGSMGRGRVNFGRALSESHAAVQIENWSYHTPDGRTTILTGDTVVLSVIARNPTDMIASDLVFQAHPADDALTVVNGKAAVPDVNPGQEISLPEFRLKAEDLPSNRTAIVRLEWNYNGNEVDARSFAVPVFASEGIWKKQVTLDSCYLWSVKAVDHNVVWAAGGKRPVPNLPLVVRTTDGGITWVDVTSNLPTPGPCESHSYDCKLCITANDAAHAWLANWNGKIYATTNGGSSWSEQTYPGAQCSSMDGIWFLDANQGFAFGEGDGGKFIVLRTSDRGVTWAHTPNEPVGLDGEWGSDNSFSFTDLNHIWLGSNKSRVWRTTDGGSTWSSGTIDGVGARSVSFRDSNNGMAACDNRISRTTDGGITWTQVKSPAISINSIGYVPGSNAARLTGFEGIFRTNDEAATWVKEPTDTVVTGLPQHFSFADSRKGWLVTDQGDIFCYQRLSTAVSEVSGRTLITAYRLKQNYPNPFNPTTTISYQVPAVTYVTLRVFDLLGREVTTLVNELKYAGSYAVNWDATRLSSGVYFYRLQAGEFVETKRMILVK